MTRRKNLKTLPPALLRLDRFWLESIRIEPDEGWDATKEPTGIPLVGESQYLLPKDSPDVILRLILKSQEKSHAFPYHFEATVAGRFSLPEDVPQGDKDQMLHINGNAIVYGIARGVIATVTGLGIQGPLHLPSINFVELFESVSTRKKGTRSVSKKRRPKPGTRARPGTGAKQATSP